MKKMKQNRTACNDVWYLSFDAAWHMWSPTYSTISKYIPVSLADCKELYPGDFGEIYSVVP